jgi:hypothetical protein
MSFQDDIDKWVQNVKKNYDQVFNDSVSTLYTSIVQMSPVDTGRFKSSWNLTINSKEAIISNPVPYGEYLEFGHSQQAPNGMVRINCQKWDEIVSNQLLKYK